MDDPFILDYIALVYVAALGTLQVAAAANGLQGLMLLGRRGLCLILGISLLGGAFTWFFLSAPRNVPDYLSGLNGTQQFYGFCAGVAAAFITTAVAAAFAQRQLGQGAVSLPEGVEGLRTSHYPRLLYWRLRGLWRR
ncbi:MAG: hypothetical protein FJ316_09145 [SAR202 cluster bacterium]|nr:hypothetical protein [SAR202 cluster bacterium]